MAPRPTDQLVTEIERAVASINTPAVALSRPIVAESDIREHLRLAIDRKVSEQMTSLFTGWSLAELATAHAAYLAKLVTYEEPPAKATSVSSTAEVTPEPAPPVALAPKPHAKRSTPKKPAR